MALTEGQKQEAQELFAKGYSTAEVFRHFGAQSIGQDSQIAIEESAIAKAETTPAYKPIAQKITGLLGLDSATQTFGDVIARSRLGAKLTGTDVETNRKFIEAPTGREIAGAALQTGATALAPAIAPASLPLQMAAGAGLGYAMDAGKDMQSGASTADTLTPGLGTAVGALTPAVLKGGFSLFQRGSQGMADDATRLALPGATPEPAPTQALALTGDVADQGTQAVPEGASALKQTVSDFGDSIKRVGTRIQETTAQKAAKAERLKTAPANAVSAIKADIDDTIIDFVATTDEPTKQALREVVKQAEAPKGLGPNKRPTQIAENYAVQQYKLVDEAKRKVGSQIGEISDQFDTLKSIDVKPTQAKIADTLSQNGITVTKSGNLVATNNLKITDEQMAVLNKLYDKVTRQETVSAKGLHQLDQWFSTMQRQSRVIDKVDDVRITVTTPDGPKDVNVFGFFRSAFGDRLDEVAPDNLRALNKQYRQYSNFMDDVESKLISNPEFSDLVSKDQTVFAEAGLRRIFGEGKGAAEREAIYNALDDVSRGLGYQGPRADVLYSFAESLKDIYPETIQKTSFRGQIGSSIMDKIGTVMDVGRVTPADKQKALKELLEMSDAQ